MRSTENVRGEWDELGERDTRVIVPGPGVGQARAEDTGAAGAAPEVEDDIPADLGPALDAVAGVGRAAPGGGGPLVPGLGLDLGPGPRTQWEPAPAPAIPGPGPELEPGLDVRPGDGPASPPVRAPKAQAPAADPALDPVVDPAAEAEPVRGAGLSGLNRGAARGAGPVNPGSDGARGAEPVGLGREAPRDLGPRGLDPEVAHGAERVNPGRDAARAPGLSGPAQEPMRDPGPGPLDLDLGAARGAEPARDPGPLDRDLGAARGAGPVGPGPLDLDLGAARGAGPVGPGRELAPDPGPMDPDAARDAEPVGLSREVACDLGPRDLDPEQAHGAEPVGLGRVPAWGPGPLSMDPDLDPDGAHVAEPLSLNPGPARDSDPFVLTPDPARAPEPLELDPDLAHAPGAPDPVPDPARDPEPVKQQPEPQPEADTGPGSGVRVEADADEATVPGPGDGVAGAAPPGGDGERAPVTLTVGAADPVAWWGAGRRQPVISTETTAPIPVHLLFRDDQDGSPTTAPGGTPRRSGERRPPLPRSRPTQQAPARPSPLADPRLTERPGPVLPGWAALATASAVAAAGLAALWWQGALPAAVTARFGLADRPYDGIGTGAWAMLALVVAVALFALLGLGRGRSGHASVLTLFGDYRGSVRRTGLLWISPLLGRRRIDVRLRHWRSEPLAAVDASGTALRAVVLVVWRVKDTARAALGVADHEGYLRDQVEAALARVLSQLPADAFLEETTRTLRDAEAVGDALTRMLKADCAPAGIEIYSAQPTVIEYAPEVAAAMQRCRVAAIDAKHRDGVLTSVVDAVDDTVGRLTARGIVELDTYEHKALVRDLTVAFYTGRSGGEGA
ncbi:SPFH domain-containing protein [Streptomyces sp. NBC_01708]|uniref:SPFH domain-containing protein n=1 Tax=Streptomyces sp. NBC_01708 TaxID=2975915 RepID=UPI002E2EF897|nr:SPFH domain-containing protein [Streptomyces sp. NBC_01708]